MVKRELIDKSEVMIFVDDVFECQCNEKEAYELLDSVPTFTEQDIVKPYLEELKTKLKNYSYEEPEGTVCFCDKEPTWIVDLDDIEYEIDNLLSEQEPKNEL